MTQKHAIILFAKDPVIGQVKTRLASHLDEKTIFNLYLNFLDDSVDKICKIAGADRFCGVHPGTMSGYFDRVAVSKKICIFLQEGKDLGERMKNALAKRFEEGYEKVVIIGSDSPSLPISYIKEAFASEKDLVVGPSTDSGYYLIGMHGKVVDVFSGVSWGTEKVLSETFARVRRIGATMMVLPVWYDVDRYDDLKFLKIHLDLLASCGVNESPATAGFLKQIELQ